MFFAAIYVPDFPVAAVVRAARRWRERAVAVLEGTPPLQKVCACNGKARRAGIEPGMTRLQAEACPDLVVCRRSLLQEASAHAALLDCAQSFSPRVEDTAGDTVMLDLGGLERLFGPLPRMARELARRASELGLETNVAAASNPDAALHAARGFPGVTVVPPGKEAERLGSLPLDVLAIGPEMLETFDRWGVRKLRALAALPEVAVSERLGQEGVRLQKLARGQGSRTLVAVEPPLRFEEIVELEYPLAQLEPLAFLLNRMLEQLCARLSARALAAQELRLQLELDAAAAAEPPPQPEADPGSFAPQRNADQRGSKIQSELSAPPCLRGESKIFERVLRLPVPMLDAKVFLKLLQLDLQAHSPGAPVSKVRLAAEPARPRTTQGGLFLPRAPEPEKLELILARIAGVVSSSPAHDGKQPGQEAFDAQPIRVGSPELLDTHRPEGFRMLRFRPALAEGQRQAEEPEPRPAVTCLRVFRPPLRILVVMHAGSPVRLACPTQAALRGEIVWSAGPWRASGDWWSLRAWARDEWEIALEHQAGTALYRLFCDLGTGQWFLEGTYD